MRCFLFPCSPLLGAALFLRRCENWVYFSRRVTLWREANVLRVSTLHFSSSFLWHSTNAAQWFAHFISSKMTFDIPGLLLYKEKCDVLHLIIFVKKIN